MNAYNIITIGVIASTLAGLLTFIGALPLVFFRNIPETHRKNFENYATSGVMIGFAIMTILDNTL